jgi:hypothetical protein
MNIKNTILATLAAISIQFTTNAGISDTLGGKPITPQKKAQLLAYTGRSPLVKLEKSLLIVKLDIESGRYDLNTPMHYRTGLNQSEVRFAVADADNLLAYFYSPAFRVLTRENVEMTQFFVLVMNQLHDLKLQHD